MGFLARHSLLVDRVVWTLESRRKTRRLVDDFRQSFEPRAKRWMVAREALEKAALVAKWKQLELVLMIFPVLWNLSDSYPFSEIHESVSSFAKKHGIPVLDLLPEFDGFDGPELWVHPENQHPNEKAHAIAGEALFRFLPSEDGAALSP